METSIFLARLLGPCFLIVGLGLVCNHQAFAKIMEDYDKNAALVFLGGLIALFFGLIVVLFHNVWAADWRLLITIYGWGGIIKGAWLIFLPHKVSKFTRFYQKHRVLLMVHAGIVLVVGAVLTMFGYCTG